MFKFIYLIIKGLIFMKFKEIFDLFDLYYKNKIGLALNEILI